MPKVRAPRSPDSPEPGDTASDTDFRIIDRARVLFREAFPAEEIPETWSHGNRSFSIDDYLGFMLLGLYVPTCDSLRGLCKASELDMFKERYSCFAMDLASVSKAQAHVPDEKLLSIIGKLSGQVQQEAIQNFLESKQGYRPASAREMGKHVVRAIDSSVFAALPEMVWALFGAGHPRKDGRKTASVRLHVSFDPHAQCPAACAVTSAAIDEKRIWPVLRKRASVHNGERPVVEVGDRHYGSDYKALSELTGEGVNFVVRVKEGIHFETLEEIPLGEEDKTSGIIRHAWVRLGTSKKNRFDHRVRVIWLERPGKTIVLATNLACEEAKAVTVAGMYSQRWQIELFFWWIKKIMKVGHWLARSEKGVRIQLYLVMILALLLQLQTGRRPTKRMIELLQFYAQGLVDETQLVQALKERAREADMARDSSRKRYLAKKQASQK